MRLTPASTIPAQVVACNLPGTGSEAELHQEATSSLMLAPTTSNESRRPGCRGRLNARTAMIAWAAWRMRGHIPTRGAARSHYNTTRVILQLIIHVSGPARRGEPQAAQDVPHLAASPPASPSAAAGASRRPRRACGRSRRLWRACASSSSVHQAAVIRSDRRGRSETRPALRRRRPRLRGSPRGGSCPLPWHAAWSQWVLPKSCAARVGRAHRHSASSMVWTRGAATGSALRRGGVAVRCRRPRWAQVTAMVRMRRRRC